ncbi:MAG: hypothetical protein ACI4KH_03985 [Oscillospiraceae bacterium]
MDKKYVYKHHSGWDIFYTDHELSDKERYCSFCDEYNIFVDVCEDEESFGKLLTELFAEGYDLAPCSDFNEIIEKYGTEEQKEWYLSEEYAKHGLAESE